MQVAITSATLKTTATPDASGNYQPYCAVVGTINAGRVGTKVAGQTDAQTTYAIGFQVNLPSTWNGNLFFSGGGGTDGSIPNTTGTVANGEAVNPLLMGYATASDDSGHNGTNNDNNNAGGAAFGLDEQARIDFGYNAIGLTKQLANALISRYYAKAQTRSYFAGCSEGGREAMMVAQRFGNQFDGIIAGDPGSDLPKAWLAEAWNTQQFGNASRAQGLFETTGPGAGVTPLLNAAIQPAQWTALQTAILNQCDAADGLVDGMVNKTCTFDVTTLTCGAAGAPAACLLPAQTTALKNVVAGAKNTAGTSLYSDWPWDPGIGQPGWLVWNTGFYGTTGTNRAINVTLGGGAGPLIFTTPPTLGLATANSLVNYELNFNFDTDTAKLTATTPTYPVAPLDFMGTHSTDLSAFKAKGGKMILYHGRGDPVFSFNYSAGWVDFAQPDARQRHGQGLRPPVRRARHEPLRRRPGHRQHPGLHGARELGREGPGARQHRRLVEHDGAGDLRLGPAGRRDDAGAAALPVPAVRALHRRDRHERGRAGGAEQPEQLRLHDALSARRARPAPTLRAGLRAATSAARAASRSDSMPRSAPATKTVRSADAGSRAHRETMPSRAVSTTAGCRSCSATTWRRRRFRASRSSTSGSASRSSCAGSTSRS